MQVFSFDKNINHYIKRYDTKKIKLNIKTHWY